MPNRVIKESIKSSEKIDSLTWFEEVVFYRLLVSADDFGRFDGRPVYLKNELFPTKESVTKKAIEDAIQRLASVGLLCKYEVSGKPYLFFPAWEKHQKIRNKRSKYPPPPQNQGLDNNLQTIVSNLQTNEGQLAATCPLESESESESNSSCPDTAAAEPDGPPNRKGRVYGPDDKPYRAARHLAKKIHENIPSAKPITEKQLQEWSNHFRLLHEQDGYDWNVIADVLDYSQEDEFWKKNILSGGTFRRQFLKLLAKAGVGNE